MILFVSSSGKESAALVTACDHRSWTSYACTSAREFRPLAEKIQPRVIVVRHRLLDGYSDDVLVDLKELPARVRPRVIVLMTADRSARAEARQISLGADCVLHDPVRTEILFEYLAKYRTPPETLSPQSQGRSVSFSVAGVEVLPHEHRMVRGGVSRHLAPQEVALLRLLASAADEVVPYPVLYSQLFARRFDGDTSNCRVLLCKVLTSFKKLGVELKPFIHVIPKSGYLFTPAEAGNPRKTQKSWHRSHTRPQRRHTSGKRIQRADR
jgi:DNA-binding response OmpR family regulator